MAIDRTVKFTVRLNMLNPAHVTINKVLNELNLDIFKSKNQFFIDAATYYIENYGQEELTQPKKEKEPEFVSTEDMEAIEERIRQAAKEEARQEANKEVMTMVGSLLAAIQAGGGAMSVMNKAKNLEKIIATIDSLDWYSAREEGLGNLYEGLLEKNANEKKSGAGQYFTPRVLIDVMTKLMKPQVGERCNDPACGTFGFMIAAHQYVAEHTDNFFDIEDADMARFEREEAFTGCELVHDTHRLALMNAMLHDIEAPITLGDTLSNIGKSMHDYDLVLTNPPFGTKKGGERATRDDFTYPTSNNG